MVTLMIMWCISHLKFNTRGSHLLMMIMWYISNSIPGILICWWWSCDISQIQYQGISFTTNVVEMYLQAYCCNVCYLLVEDNIDCSFFIFEFQCYENKLTYYVLSQCFCALIKNKWFPSINDQRNNSSIAK